MALLKISFCTRFSKHYLPIALFYDPFSLLLILFCFFFASSAECCDIETSVPGNWSLLKTKKDCDLAKKILLWKSLEDDDASFEEITDFYHDNPAWPNQIALKRKAEQVIDDDTPKEKILKWFHKNPPVTASGAIAFAKIAHSSKDTKIIEEIFPKIGFSKKELESFIKAAHGLLKNKDYINRFDHMMKSEQVEDAEMILPYLPKGYLSVAKDRLALAKGHFQKRKNVNLPGYLWQYAISLLKAEKNDELFKMLKEKKVLAVETLDPELWWTSIRRVLVRRLLEKKRFKEAYEVSSNSKMSKGIEFAEAKWLEGWINLRFLKRPKEALSSFQLLYDRAETALNLSKAAYWAARASEVQKNEKHKREWLEKASKHRASFYGQLANDMLQKPFPPEDLVVSKAENKAFEEMEIVRVIRLLHKVCNIELSELFFWKLAISVSKPDEHELLIKLASEVAGPYAAVQVTKIGAKHVMPIINESYPQVEKAHMPSLSSAYNVNIHALIHAIIRQESLFKLQATSHRGAKGLMQILDGTAKLIAKQSGIQYSNVYDPKSNIALGEAHIKGLLKRYEGSLILTLAAYNAGPSPVDRWVKQFGYPGEPDGFEAVEWIAMIPYRETRHYVERVLENYWRYSVSFDGIPIKAWHKSLF